MQRTFREVMFLQDLNQHDNIIKWVGLLHTAACNHARGASSGAAQQGSVCWGQLHEFNVGRRLSMPMMGHELTSGPSWEQTAQSMSISAPLPAGC